MNGSESYIYSGYDIAAIGDHNGDGLDDLTMGTVYHTTEGLGAAGAVSIFNGSGL